MKIRLTPEEAAALRAMALNHVVVIAKDVSVRAVGAVESAFSSRRDADREAGRLSDVYDQESAFLSVDLRDTNLEFIG